MVHSSNIDSVQQVLVAAASASIQADSKAARRRVRQRLHKKLGSTLLADEYEKLMKEFEVLTRSAQPAKDRHMHLPVLLGSSLDQQPSNSSCNMLPVRTAGMALPPVAATGVLAPGMQEVSILNQSHGAPGATKQEDALCKQDRTLSCASTAAYSPEQAFPVEDLEDLISEPCAQWKRAITDPDHSLPVKRTFIQFDTREQLPLRRSSSV